MLAKRGEFTVTMLGFCATHAVGGEPERDLKSGAVFEQDHD
jgi:hypothetical protein